MEVPALRGEGDVAHSAVTTLSTERGVANLERRDKELQADLTELLGYTRQGSWAQLPSPHGAPAVGILEFPDLRVMPDSLE